ncbi:NB-ARC domain-containing protein [Streptomyces sp. NBC_00237]|uniref:ATP-binding protein n=1 Tax=Streptomyces sp. NBC_00237 TaxID=2975687 RepID=UPI00224F0BE1|nr:NB-ARC domain-containing protein [Streptomyces sp. NBC_00237]MCX5205659.1 NB-ARC domain-containing protein [Streptomyces sp. NBC_00237]
MRQQGAGNLPSETRELYGRQQELAEIRRLFDDGARLVTLAGVGGVGKTRLALRAAHEVQASFRDGVWWVELSSLRRGALLAHTVTEVLALVDQTTRPVIDVLADYLAGREALLVLDTCEHLVHECGLAADVLLRAAPGLRILVTSRRPLGIHVERLLTVDPLPVPEDEGAPCGGADAMALLAARAAEAVPGFEVTDANRPDLVRLCRCLDGLPLAIELAAARLRDLSVADLTEKLDDRFAVLGTTDEVVYDAEPPWHQALRTAIGWSHELCTPAERLLWARLSVLVGGFDVEAARAVCADARLPEETILGLLSSLTDKSVVRWEPTGGGERYRMLDTIREFGAAWLRGLGEESTLRHRHRDYFRALAQAADAAWMGPDQIAWHDRTTAEHANLRAALDFCLAEQDGHSGLQMAGALWFFWYACGFAQEGEYYLDRALDLDPTPGPDRAKALWARGMVGQTMGDMETGLRLIGTFREAAADETDETVPAAAAILEGACLALSGRQTRAAEVLDAAPRTPPPPGRYDAAWSLVQVARAFVHIQLGQVAEAAVVADGLCAVCDRHGETHARAWGDYLRALAALALGRAAEAEAHAREALDGKRRVRDSLGIAMALEALAAARLVSGHAERAAQLLGTADRVWQTLGSPQLGAPELVAARQACEEQARQAIGDDNFEAAFRASYDSDPDAGITHALHAPGTASAHPDID